MSNSIWKDKSEVPEKSFRKIYYEYTGLDNSIGCEINNSYWYPSSNTIRWCYLDDLLSQSDRIEKLEQAVSAAREEYWDIIESEFPLSKVDYHMKNYDKRIESILKGDNNE